MEILDLRLIMHKYYYDIEEYKWNTTYTTFIKRIKNRNYLYIRINRFSALNMFVNDYLTFWEYE